jgi:DNA-binding NarL/FixJ family response regulator
VSAAASVAPLAVSLLGTKGLALEVVRRLLDAHGVVIAEGDEEDELVAAVTVLVEPRAEDWAQARLSLAPIVLVTDGKVSDDEAVDAAIAGADAVLHCGSSPESVLLALDAVAGGGSLLAPRAARAVAALARAAAAKPGVSLSRREAEILNSISRGHAVKQTARELAISAKTVENLQGRLFRKLGVRNRAQAVARAHGLGLL